MLCAVPRHTVILTVPYAQSLWIYTSEIFPTNIRAFGLGVTTAFARIGGAVSPFIAHMVFSQDRNTALFICALAGIVAAGLMMLMPHETQV